MKKKPVYCPLSNFKYMKRNLKNKLLLLLIISISFSCADGAKKLDREALFANIEQQLQGMVDVTQESSKLPRCSNEDGSLRLVKSSDWTSGFFPGVLWLQYDYSQDAKWKTLAEEYTTRLEKQQFNTHTHDVGFMMYCSYGTGYRLNPTEAYKEVLINSAKSLITRYNPQVKCIRSWDHNRDKWDFPVIIDNMMNLELLFWATSVTGDSTYYNVAYHHASTTLKNHFRPDNSCYHVIGYDPETGEVLQKNTHQGYADESAWARGQGWALYGFTMAYRETGDQRFLAKANDVAQFIMHHKRLPDDGIPYWDFDDPTIPNAPRDASAAAVISSALYELALYADEVHKLDYKAFADKVLDSLSSEAYFAEVGTNNHFLLKHSVGNKPKNDEVDQPIIYADYYYMEALLRQAKYEKGTLLLKHK